MTCQKASEGPSAAIREAHFDLDEGCSEPLFVPRHNGYVRALFCEEHRKTETCA